MFVPCGVNHLYQPKTINFLKNSEILTGKKIFISLHFSYPVTEGATPQQSLEAKNVNSVIKRSLR